LKKTTEGSFTDRQHSLVDDISDGYYAFNAETGQFHFLNKRSLDLIGYTNQEALGLRVWDVIVPAERLCFKAQLTNFVENATRKSEHWKHHLLRKDRSNLMAEFSASLVTYNDMQVVQGTLRDITDYESLQQQIELFQRLETITTLASTLTNQFGKALDVIQANVRSLEKLCVNDEALLRHLSQMKGALHHIEGLTDNLLTFAHGREPEYELLPLTDVLVKILPLISQSLPNRIRFKTELAEDLPYIKTDMSQLQMILTAVIANAEEAIEGRGHIVFSARNSGPDPEFFEANADLKPGKYVCMAVKDSGKGMDEQVRRRVCEPFFTTKLHSRGIGMAAVYGMVKKQGGWLSIQSKQHLGTTVNIYLPSAV
jgi:PAS domain S-box-containing protein